MLAKGTVKRFASWALQHLAPEEDRPCSEVFRRDQVFWAMRNIPAREATTHFLLCGTTGSGKTTALRLFLQSIAPRFQSANTAPEQLIIFDAKGEAVPILAGLGLRPTEENVWILNPYDARSAVWNVGEATETPLMSRRLATLMIPEEPHSKAPFFSNAARELVYAVILGLNTVAPSAWSFRDLLCALDSREHITAIARHHPRATRIVAGILKDDIHSSSIVSTIATRVGQFEQVASLWHTNDSGKVFSIREFMKVPGVLVLGYDEAFKESLWPINAMLLNALTQEVLRSEETDQPRYWFLLDEFRAMHNVECTHDLLNRGRSKGAAVVLGIQSIPGLVEVYGEQGTDDILSLCTHKSFLRVGDPKTAEWAEKYFGAMRRMEVSTSHSEDSNGHTSVSVSQQLQDRPHFLASFFLDLPLAGKGKPFAMVNDIPYLRTTFVTERRSDDVFAMCKPRDPNVVGVEHRKDLAKQTLSPWSADEQQSYIRIPADKERLMAADEAKLRDRKA